MTDLLIVTAPFTYTFGPSLAPALLKACATKNQISARAWDISADFNHYHRLHESYNNILSWMNSPELTITADEYQWYQNIVINYAQIIVNQYCPKNLAVSLLTQNSQRFAEDLCYHVKSIDPGIKILLGGSGMDILQYAYQAKWFELMLSGNLADTVILGEGEYALPRVIKQNLYGMVKEPQLTNDQLSQLPIPDYDDYDFSLYKSYTQSFWNPTDDVKKEQDLIFLITTSKGCVKDCSFCDVGKIWNKFRYRDAESVANEIITLHKKYNASYFSFTDNLINGGMKIFHQINTILSEQIPNTIRYEGQMICRSKRDMPEKHYQAMAQAGCDSVSIGIESGSETVRMHMRKGSSQEDIYYTTEMLTKYNIKQKWFIVVGYPTETDNDWQQTMSLIKYWLPRTNGLLVIVPSSTYLLLDGTPMTDTDKYQDLELQKSTLHGYSQFAWTSGINPGNTFDVRGQRFLELCTYLLEYNQSEYSHLTQNIITTKKRLSWYQNEPKLKKVFNLSVN